MRKILTIRGFQDYLANKGCTKILFASVDQGTQVYSKMNFYIEFNAISFHLGMAKKDILLKADNGGMEIKDVYGIKIEEDGCILGDIVSVFCNRCEEVASYKLCRCK